MCTLLTAALPFMMACDDEESTDPYDINYVYIYSPVSTDNTLEYKGNGTFLVEIEPECVVNPVRCTKPAPADLTIHFGVDPTLVDSYNKANGTNYTLLKSVQLENSALQIKKGEYISVDSLKVHYMDMAEFQSGAENFLLPITITSIEGAGVSKSVNSTIYLTFTSIYRVNAVTMDFSESMNLEYENGGFINLLEKLDLGNGITSQWTVDDDIHVSLKIEPNLINAYNALNGTKYILMPNVDFENSTLLIKKGASSPEENIVLIFSDAMANVKLGENYIIPIVISEVNGVGAGIGETSAAFVTFTTVEKLTLSVENDPVGTAITDFTGWNITVDGETESYYGGKWLDLVTAPGSWIDTINLSSIIDVDMNGLKKLSSIQFSYLNNSFSALEVSIGVSADGMNYKVGKCSLTAAKKQTFVLQHPTEIQYIRIIFSDCANGSGTYPTALYVYVTE